MICLYIRQLTDEEKHAFFMTFMYYDGRRDPVKWLAEDMIYELHSAETAPLIVVKQGEKVMYRGLLRRLE